MFAALLAIPSIDRGVVNCIPSSSRRLLLVVLFITGAGATLYLPLQLLCEVIDIMLSSVNIPTTNLVSSITVLVSASNAPSFSLLSWACGISSLRSLTSAVDSLSCVDSTTYAKYSPLRCLPLLA